MILGIDPGKTGGFTVVDTSGIVRAVPAYVKDVSATYRLDAHRILNELRWGELRDQLDAVVIEQVHAFPKQGVVSSFQFGRMYGSAEVIAHCFNVEPVYVHPSTWKRAMGLSSNKRQSFELATKLFGKTARAEWFPENRDEGIVEAALLAVWYTQSGGGD